MPYGAMRQGDWRFLIHYAEMDIELYNLKEDIGETRNLAKSHPKKAREMHENFKAWLKHTSAQMPTKDPDYIPGMKPQWPGYRKRKAKKSGKS